MRGVVADAGRGGNDLPFETSSAIFLGGGGSSQRAAERRAQVEETGTLLASGLLAVAAVSNLPSLTHLVSGREQFSWLATWGGWLSLGGFAGIAYALIRIPLAKR